MVIREYYWIKTVRRTMSSNRSGTHIPERWTLSWRTVMIAYTMIEPRSDRVTVCSPQTQHCYQVIRTTRVHQSSRSSKMVTVQERVVRSRLQLGYSTPTSFINRYLFIISTSPKSLTIYRTWSWRMTVIDSLFAIESNVSFRNFYISVIKHYS